MLREEYLFNEFQSRMVYSDAIAIQRSMNYSQDL